MGMDNRKGLINCIKCGEKFWLVDTYGMPAPTVCKDCTK